MNFNELVKEHLFLILQKYGFELTEEMRNILRFQSSDVYVNISYSKFEMRPGISIGRPWGRPGEFVSELTDEKVKKFFHSSLSVDYGTPEGFVQNLSVLFQSEEGDRMLKGGEYLDEFIKYSLEKNKEYFDEQMRQQEKAAALRARKTKV